MVENTKLENLPAASPPALEDFIYLVQNNVSYRATVDQFLSLITDLTGAEIKALYELEPSAFTDALFTKLAGIETAATADQTGAEIKTAYEAEANAYTDTKNTKLAGIETSATADQTGGEIKTAYEGEADTNAFDNAAQSKLSGITAGAEVNPDVVTQGDAEAGTSTAERTWTPQRVKQAIDALVPQSAYPRAVINGFNTRRDPGDTTNDIEIAQGSCRSQGDGDNIDLTGLITKRLDADWVVGDNQGGFPSGLTLSNLWYHVFVIKRTDTGVVDAGFDTSITAANLLTDASDYDEYRRVASILRVGGAVRAYYQYGDQFDWDLRTQELAGASNTSGANITLDTPLGIPMLADVSMDIFGSTAGHTYYGLLTSPLITNTAPSLSINTVNRVIPAGSTTGGTGRRQHILTNTSSQIRHRVNTNTLATWRIFTWGWRDIRGTDL